MKTNKSWFSNIISGNNGGLSSKRFFGGIGLVIMHILAVISVVFFNDSSWIGELLITLTVTDGGLLGVGVLEKTTSKTATTTSDSAKEETYDETEG